MNKLTIEDARKIFLSMLIARSYDGSLRTMSAYLEGNLPTKQLSLELVTLQAWVNGLDDESRQNVQKIIQKAVDSAIFGYLVLLDGLTGGNPVQGTTSDFALYLQIYNDDESRAKDITESRIRVNSPEFSEFLHDLYRDMIEEHNQ